MEAAVQAAVQAVEDGEGATATVEASGTSVRWDPVTSLDWDRETYTREAIVRIKG